MIDNIWIGPVILYNRMTRHNCLDFQQNGLPELEAVPLATRIALYFLHDTAPSHHT
jgi:hypothetical protein